MATPQLVGFLMFFFLFFGGLIDEEGWWLLIHVVLVLVPQKSLQVPTHGVVWGADRSEKG